MLHDLRRSKKPDKEFSSRQGYEITATADAPGPWDAVKGSVRYGVANVECTPKNEATGVHLVPDGLWRDIKLIRTGDNTWKGTFFRDFLQDEDYYGLGTCHWDGSQAAVIFKIRDVSFGSAQFVNEALNSPQSSYYKNSDFLSNLPRPSGLQDYSSSDADVTQHKDDYIKITVTAKELPDESKP